MIQFEDIHKKFGRKAVLKGVSVHLEEPGIYAVLGPNGSGKTTLIKSLMGLVKPNRGRILFMHHPIKGDAYRSQIAYLPQIARFPENLTTAEFLQLIEKLRGAAARKEELIDYFQLEEYRNQTLRQLSGGTRQKINLTAALMYNTKTIVLDEPTIGLDPVALLRLKDWLRKERGAGKMILFTTHVMDLVQELAGQIVFILEGQVYYHGNQENLFAKTGTPDVEHAIAKILTQKEAV